MRQGQEYNLTPPLGHLLGCGLALGILRAIYPFRLLPFDALVNLLPVDRNIARGVHPNPNLVSLYPEDGHGDLVADHQGLADSTR
jgi:hypothetical protein